jgi:hypothetical protein
MQQPIPKCIVLQTASGERLGFILIAIPDGASFGQCVFMVVPKDARLLRTPEAEALWARKTIGESDINVSRGALLVVHVSSANLPDLTVELKNDGTGTWSETTPGSMSGLASTTTAVT